MPQIISQWINRFLIFIGIDPLKQAKHVRQPKAEAGKPDRASDVERAGRHYFRRDILDKLDVYFEMIGRIKKHDPGAYHLYRRVGAVVMSGKSQATAAFDDLSWIMKNPVGFGAVAYCIDEVQDGFVPPQFTYFQKLDRLPSAVQRLGPTNYHVGTFLSDNHCEGIVHFYCCIKDDQFILLKERRNWKQRRREGKEWNYPSMLRDAAREHNTSPHDMAKVQFAWTYQIYCQASMDVRVSAKRGKDIAVFGVDLLRIPYFFSDRDKIKTESGRTKRIFHIVRPHGRQLQDGRRVNVRPHFRGLRQFRWNDCDVVVSMPGKHHKDLLTFDHAANEYDPDDPALLDPDLRNMKQTGKILDQHLRA